MNVWKTISKENREKIMVSIKDVAKEAGVAVSTVSKVLNNYPGVSSETKIKVNQAIEKLNFVPNAVASCLSSKKNSRVAILLNQTSQTTAIDEIDMQYLSGAIVKAKELGLDVITIFFSMLQDMSEKEIVTYLKSQSITGLLILGLSRDDEKFLKLIEEKEFKVSLVDVPIVNESTSSIWIDQKKAQREVIENLLESDKVKSLLYIFGKENGFVTKERIEAVRKLCKERKLDLALRCGNFSEKQAREIVLKEGKKYDMIACASDLMAIGAMKALTDMDIFRPVCGFDGITLMGYVGKMMTTVRQNFYGISSLAMVELERLLLGNEGRQVIAEHEIVKIDYMDIIR